VLSPIFLYIGRRWELLHVLPSKVYGNSHLFSDLHYRVAWGWSFNICRSITQINKLSIYIYILWEFMNIWPACLRPICINLRNIVIVLCHARYDNHNYYLKLGFNQFEVAPILSISFFPEDLPRNRFEVEPSSQASRLGSARDWSEDSIWG
jgi:hypothetical protein